MQCFQQATSATACIVRVKLTGSISVLHNWAFADRHVLDARCLDCEEDAQHSGNPSQGLNVLVS